MINRCGSCREYHWSYTGAPFRPWCSFDCWDSRHKQRQQDHSEERALLLYEITAHNIDIHGTPDNRKWFAFCDTCVMLHEALDFYDAAARSKSPSAGSFDNKRAEKGASR